MSAKYGLAGIKKQVAYSVKKWMNRFGYDIRIYHPHLDLVLASRKIATVIDIGANNGQFATDIHARLPDAMIYSFEPIRSCYEELLVNMKDAERFHAFNVGLGERDAAATIHKSAFTPSSSLLPMGELHKKIYPKSVNHTEEEIQIKALDSMTPQMLLDSPFLIKVDVQGYEDKVIAGGTAAFSRASVVVIETSFKTLYEGQPLFGDIHGLLTSLGFSYYGNHGQHWDPKTGELIYEDSIFVR